MERMNLPFFCQLGEQLGRLADLDMDTASRLDMLIACWQVAPSVRVLLETYSPSVCRGAAVELLAVFEEARNLVGNTEEEVNKKMADADHRLRRAVYQARDFRTILLAELATLSTYHVGRVGIYDTTQLIEHAEETLLPSVLAKIGPEASDEVRQSGRCLAFGVPTASGFHMIRAIESVLHRYYLAVCQPNPPPAGKLESWGAYIAELRKKGETDAKAKVSSDVKKVEALIQQIKDRDRNLIMHPDIVLGPEEAFSLFEIGKGVIVAMAESLPAPEKATA
jgi:hypothetical protein